MDVNDNAGILNKRVALESIASRLAPTRVRSRSQNPGPPLPPCGSGLAREGVLETSIIIPALGDLLLDHRRIRVLSRWKFPLQAPCKRNDLGNRQIQLLWNAVPQFHARQQSHKLGIFVDRHFAVAGDP
ncbi:hypothetical protein D3C72_863220 [compost metagenome]